MVLFEAAVHVYTRNGALPRSIMWREVLHCHFIVSQWAEGSLSLSPQNSDMTGCDLQHANLRGSNLGGAVFTNIIAPLHMSQTVNVSDLSSSDTQDQT